MKRGWKWPGRRATVAAVLAGLALWQLASAAYIPIKAELAQYLLADAWQRTLRDGERHRPWSWADTWPVARLGAPEQGEDLIVLAGASGRNLAFGPTHVSATAAVDARGNSVIVGHRDTHFRWLERVRDGDRLVLESSVGERVYRVVRREVVHESDLSVMDENGEDALTLVTCYPFGALDPDTDQRFVVQAVGMSEN